MLQRAAAEEAGAQRGAVAAQIIAGGHGIASTERLTKA
jgi:hypothetical protein